MKHNPLSSRAALKIMATLAPAVMTSAGIRCRISFSVPSTRCPWISFFENAEAWNCKAQLLGGDHGLCALSQEECEGYDLRLFTVLSFLVAFQVLL